MNDIFTNAQRAEVLTQALPYIKRYSGKIVAIKYGGNAMIDENLKEQVMEDIALLWLIGVKVVLIHGGGPEINDLMQRVDALIEEMAEEDDLIGCFSSKSRGARVERSHIRQQFDPSAAVLTKTKKELRLEEKLQKQAEKKASVNRSIGGLVFLAVLECIGILAILGWWLQ